MISDLERLAREAGTKWTYKEVVAGVYRALRDQPLEAAQAHLQSTLSDAALVSIQNAAQDVLQRMEPDEESFGIGYIIPEAPVDLDSIEQVPRAFVERIAGTLNPSPEA